MSRFLSVLCASATLVILSGAVSQSNAQIEVNSNTPQDLVTLIKLSRPVYPPLALQARITGDVELSLSVRLDGIVESAEVVSGHPLLKQVALDSAQKSQFECRTCSGALTPYRLVYTFEFGPTTLFCTAPDNKYPQVIQSQNHVTVVAQPVGTCDPIEIRKVRSAKCLYLWKCGHR